MKYFQCIEHPLDLSRYTYSVTDNLCKEFGPLCGTYGVLPARLLGMSYENYIVYLFKTFGNKVSFPHYLSCPIFEKKEDAMKMAEMLDERFNYLVVNRKSD